VLAHGPQRMNTTALAYEVDAPGRGMLRSVELPKPGRDDVVVRAQFSGISVGTERLVGTGLVPASCADAMRVPGMHGSFALPIRYGYSLVGTIDGGRRVFTMHPHQEIAIVANERTVALPDDVPSPRATLLPNLETAWNAVHDAELRAGERVAVIGAGAIGLLLAFALRRIAGAAVVLVDTDAARRRFAAERSWADDVVAPDGVVREHFDVAFHTTGTSDGLQLAIDAVGFEGRVLELSWYGEKPVTLRLGESFHWQRKRIVGSQVGAIAKSRRAAGHAARTAAVLDLLRDPRLDALLVAPIPFRRLPEAFARIYRGEAIEPCPVVAY